jgi:G3E family GTPase
LDVIEKSALQPIPLTIITGFLGSGKTTLLNRILHTEHGLRVAVMVNDFEAVNIDSQLIVGVEGETVSLSNGCICCTIRGDLLKAVLELLRRADPPEYILVETSGVSDPLEVALTFRAINRIRLDSILTVMDAEQILSIDRRYAVLAMNQVGMADIVIVNKVDLVDAEQLAAVRAYIRSIIPNSRVIEATEAAVPLELLLNIGAFDLQRLSSRTPQDVHVHAEDEAHHEHGDNEHEHDHIHTDHTLVFSTWSWTTDQPISYRALKRTMTALPDTIYRAKGIFFLADDPDHQAVLQVVGRRATLTLERAWGEDAPQSQLVVIGAAGELDDEDLNGRLKACLAVNAPKSELERLTTHVIEWLRGRLPSVS